MNMANKWIALNILLLIAAVGMGRELYQRYEHFKATSDPARIESVPTENQAAAKAAPGSPIDASMEKLITQPADYFIISEKTLFSDQRGNEEIVSVVAPKVAPLNPKPVLVGVAMIDGQYTASVRNPIVAQQPGRTGQPATETWRIGDYYRGYRVASIERDQLVLVHPENSAAREVLPLNRSAGSVQPRPVITSAAQVVSIGPGSGPSGSITVSTAATQVAGRGAATTAVQNAAARQAQLQQAQQPAQAKPAQAKPQQSQVTVSTPNGEVTVQVPENIQDLIQLRSGTQKPQPGTNANPAQGGRQQIQQRTVSTPFGEIIRPGIE